MAFSALQQLLLEVLQANQLVGTSPYTIVSPKKPGSTWTFGTPQFDVGNYSTAYSTLADILLHATDANGNFIISPSDTQNRGSVGSITDSAISQLMQDAGSGSALALSSANQALINAALS